MVSTLAHPTAVVVPAAILVADYRLLSRAAQKRTFMPLLLRLTDRDGSYAQGQS